MFNQRIESLYRPSERPELLYENKALAQRRRFRDRRIAERVQRQVKHHFATATASGSSNRDTG